ncbi:MAG: SDR family NAD(P)-dependent oxidoreductase [Bacteriovoracaceae bacterium]|nr:SDR family NAD(P)-dependent oxidoreductase [Bacteriovoracaceae bacterium]
MKYLVTGAAGFIAAKTAEFLLKDGHSVVGIDNMNDYYDVTLKEHRLENLRAHKNFEFQKIDIENKTDLESIFKKSKFDAVLNLAARAGVRFSMEHPEVYMTTNAMGTLNLLNLMRDHQVKKMVLASTSSLYAGQPMPFVETLPVNTPISPYAASKKAAEVMAYTYSFLYKMDVSVVRYFTVYGPASRPDMAVFRFIKWIDEGTPIELFGDGLQSRDFTFVDDIARGTIAALKPVGYEVINLGGGNNPIDLLTVIKMMEKHLGKTAKIQNKEFHIADVKSTWADISKAEKFLGWKPQVSLEEGIRQSVDWYLSTKKYGFKV